MHPICALLKTKGFIIMKSNNYSGLYLFENGFVGAGMSVTRVKITGSGSNRCIVFDRPHREPVRLFKLFKYKIYFLYVYLLSSLDNLVPWLLVHTRSQVPCKRFEIRCTGCSLARWQWFALLRLPGDW